MRVEKYDSKENPFNLNACENAFIEECQSGERAARKKVKNEEFHNDTRLNLLEKLQEIEADKKRE